MSKRRTVSKKDLSYEDFFSPKDLAKNIIEKPVKITGKNERQVEFIKMIKEKEIIICSGAAGTGKSYISVAQALKLIQQTSNKYEKIWLSRPVIETGKSMGHLPGPQPLYTKVLTPNGWTTMGELKVGDEVFAYNGEVTKITGVFPKGKKDVYKVEVTNGGVTYACEDHVWATKTYQELKHGKDFSIRSTKEIKDTLLNNNKGPKYNHYLPKSGVIQFNEKELYISPYVMGILLGDGSLSNSIVFTSIDDDVINRVTEELSRINVNVSHQKNTINYNLISNKLNNKPSKSVVIEDINTNRKEIYDGVGEASKHTNLDSNLLTSRCSNNTEIDGKRYYFIDDRTKWSNPIKQELFELGLLGKKSHNKFIPDLYKYNSKENRISLLQGLLDSDGTIKPTTGEVSMTTTSIQLRDDVVELCKSLGINATYITRDRVGKVSQIEGRDINTRLIAYDISIPKLNSKDFNYFHLSRKQQHERLATKNKHIRVKDIKFHETTEVQCIQIEHPSHLYITNDYIVTHNTMEEKLMPYIQPLFDNIDKIIGKEKRIKLVEEGIIEFQPLGFIRGKTIDNGILILDETQNATPNELKAVLTRIGENSKFILSGDIDQSDLYKDFKQCGLYDVVNRLSDIEGIGLFEFRESDIVRNPIISEILKRYK